MSSLKICQLKSNHPFRELSLSDLKLINGGFSFGLSFSSTKNDLGNSNELVLDGGDYESLEFITQVNASQGSVVNVYNNSPVQVIPG